MNVDAQSVWKGSSGKGGRNGDRWVRRHGTSWRVLSLSGLKLKRTSIGWGKW